ncbi:MAG: flagellar biosynthesis protein FlhA [Gammaproteobacteria bacterium]|nr:flagellar biosynthesis protein FlhA [Gammaproteobacteria bacterium]
MATLVPTTSSRQVLGTLQRNGLAVPGMLLALLAMMILPLPPLLLDVLFTFNIALSIIVLLASIYARRPLDFAAFPSVLLGATLLRLALNIASTRVVLLHGHTGPTAAGQVIHAFGNFVIGGNYAVGFVVFAILVIINFVVVTKGAGRIAEVSARFTLDAMPGKQMAIDADLNAGVLSQQDAKKRRLEVTQEADFYGAMDGASKFVRGDAVAGILIVFINILGGFIIGVMQHGLSMGDAVRIFTLLTIGDGLVAQIPGLLLAVASAVIVTRVSADADMTQQVANQLFEDPRALGVTAGILATMGLIPGMPNVAFLTMAAGAGYTAYRIAQRRRQHAEVALEVPPPPPPMDTKELSWDDVQPIDAIGLEVGYRVIPLVDRAQNGQLLGRLRGVRKKLSQELGFLIPAVHIRDNLELDPAAYRITVHGATIGNASIQPGKELAINPGQVYGQLRGVVIKDPVFNLEAVWIGGEQREQAQSLGYTVVDASTVVATHMSQVIQDHAHELLGHDEVQKLLDGLAKTSPKLVEDAVPKVVPVGLLVRVMQNLLREHVPARDIRTILEVLAERGGKSQDPVVLTAAVREAMARIIIEQINGLEDELPVITLDYSLEQILLRSVESGVETGIAIEPNLANRFAQSLREAHEKQELASQPSVLLVPSNLREFLARFVRQSVKGMHVISFNEVPDDKQLRIVATVGDGSGPRR